MVFPTLPTTNNDSSSDDTVIGEPNASMINSNSLESVPSLSNEVGLFLFVLLLSQVL